MSEAALCVAAFLFLTALFGLCALTVASGEETIAPRIDMQGMSMIAAGALAAALLPAAGIASALPAVVALASSAVCAITDAQTGYVFDRVTGPGTALVVGCAFLSGHGAAAIQGAICGASVLFALWLLTRRRGIGLGDVKLAAVIGAAAGPGSIFISLGGAFVLGASVACCGVAARRLTFRSALCFAPFMAAAFALTAVVTGLPV